MRRKRKFTGADSSSANGDNVHAASFLRFTRIEQRRDIQRHGCLWQRHADGLSRLHVGKHNFGNSSAGQRRSQLLDQLSPHRLPVHRCPIRWGFRVFLIDLSVHNRGCNLFDHPYGDWAG